MSSREIIRLMDEEEQFVLRALQAAEEPIARAAEKVAEAYQKGGRILYVGAGTSGRIATMDAAEMPPTFGVEPNRFIAVIAGGPSASGAAIEDAEDDSHSGIVALNELAVNPDDVVIGLAASGTTPFVIAAVRHARQKGVWTAGIANNANSPLLEAADLGILLNTGPEILTGSTRLKAGTSQKLALNRISTAAMVLSGKVVENLMIDVKAKNQKLKDRCARIVCELSTATRDEAYQLLEQKDWNIRRVLATLRSPALRGRG
jgi:N-acetylmuramic acid 6-phosphate etherase